LHGVVPRLSSWRSAPFSESNTLINVPLMEAVAILKPSILNAIQLKGASWATISIGDFSMLARSIIVTWPAFLPR